MMLAVGRFLVCCKQQYGVMTCLYFGILVSYRGDCESRMDELRIFQVLCQWNRDVALLCFLMNLHLEGEAQIYVVWLVWHLLRCHRPMLSSELIETYCWQLLST